MGVWVWVGVGVGVWVCVLLVCKGLPLLSALKPRFTSCSVPGGVALCVGINCFGQVGVGDDISERKNPALVRKGSLAPREGGDGPAVIAVAAGGMHTAVLTEDSKVPGTQTSTHFSALTNTHPCTTSCTGTHFWVQ